MRVKLDENLPLRLATRLAGIGHDVRTVKTEGLRGRIDLEIWGAAQREGCCSSHKIWISPMRDSSHLVRITDYCSSVSGPRTDEPCFSA